MQKRAEIDTSSWLDRDRLFGEVLVKGEFITKEQLEEAMKQVWKEGKRLFIVLRECGCPEENMLITAYSFHLKAPVVMNPRWVEVSQDAVDLIPKETALEYMVLPLSVNRDGTLWVLMEDPGDLDIVNRLANLTGRQIRPVLLLNKGLKERIEQVYA